MPYPEHMKTNEDVFTDAIQAWHVRIHAQIHERDYLAKSIIMNQKNSYFLQEKPLEQSII